MNRLRGIVLFQNGMRYINYDKKLCFPDLEKNYFHTASSLLKETRFSEKPLSVKKLKLKQARMQKDDGVPVYLKKGFRDKLLFNITLAGVILGFLHSLKVLSLLVQGKTADDL